MSYSQLVLSENPYGYWDFSDRVPSTATYASIEYDNNIYGDIYADPYSDGTLNGLYYDNSFYMDVYADNYGTGFVPWEFKVTDKTSFSNDGTVSGNIDTVKGIVPNVYSSVSFDDTSSLTIDNIYKIFLSGSESKVVTLEILFSIINSELSNTHKIFTIGNFLECYIKSDRIFLESNDGQKISVAVTNWEDVNYLAVIYDNKKLVLQVNNRNSQEIDLGQEFIFPDSSAPDIVLGPSASSSNSIYFNSLALYTYKLSTSQINSRLAWLSYFANSNGLESDNNADHFDFNSISSIPKELIKITTSENFEYSSFDNVVFQNNSLLLKTISPPVVTNDSYSLSLDGISFSNYGYINIDNFTSYAGSQNVSVTMQVLVSDLSTEQTILQFGDFLDFIYARLYVTSVGKIRLSLYYDDGSEVVVSETSTIASNSTYYDLGFSINNQEVSLIFDGTVDTYSDYFPDLYGTPYINIGNNEGETIPFTGKIKNFSIRRYEDLSSIDFTTSSSYTLKLNNSLNVSQTGTWNYIFTPTLPSVGSAVTFNTATKNAQVFINDVQVENSTIVPSYTDSTPSPISIDVILNTDDSLNEIPILNEMYISLYSDMTSFSKNNRYTLEPLDPGPSDTYVNTNPYYLRDSVSNILSKSQNLGIKFDSSINGGGAIKKYYESSSDDIRCLEFLFSIHQLPTGSDVLSIADFGQVIGKSLKYDSDGLVISGDLDVYVDGSLISTGFNMVENDMYHIFINLKEDSSEDIFVGCNYSESEMLNGSLGQITIYNSEPSGLSEYVTTRFNSYMGRIILSKSDANSIVISDSSVSNSITKTNDGKYLEMTNIPKIKLIEDKWQSIVVN